MAKTGAKAEMNVYTLMGFVVCVLLVAACVYVGWQNLELVGEKAQGNPFYIDDTTTPQ